MTLPPRLRGALRAPSHWARLSRHERIALVASIALLPAARLLLWCVGFARAAAVFGRLANPAARADAARLSRADGDALAIATFRMVRLAARWTVCGTNCLPRSLVLWTLLRRQGLEPSLRFGARKHGGDFEAHAWLELGTLVLDTESADHLPFAPFVVAS